jgi:hypothetical protein
MNTKTPKPSTRKLKTLAMVGVMAVVGTMTIHAQNLIANGDFMANAAAFVGNNGIVGPPNPSTITSWVTGAGNVGLNGPGTSAGSAYAPLNGDGGYTFAFSSWGSASSGLSQTLGGGYTAGAQYTLSFDAAQFRWAPSKAFRVSISDDSQTHFTTQVGGVDLDSTPLESFTHFSYGFTAPATFNGSSVIQLLNLDSQTAAAGVTFANVSLVAVPEPTTAALAGLGILLAGFRRWSRRNSV